MHKRSLRFPSFILFAQLSFSFSGTCFAAQNGKVMGELKFEGPTYVEKDAGVWIDGEYVGYVKELKGKKKVLLLPGKHKIDARESGYEDFTQQVIVEPGQVQTVRVKMFSIRGAQSPQSTAELKLTIQPGRAAVFLDGNYIGHAGELGGAFHSLLLSPGKHRIKVELPGYRTFETEVTLVLGQKSEVKTELAKGSIVEAGSDIKKSE